MRDKKRKRGPAPLPPDQRRNYRVSIFLTESEYLELRLKAEGLRLPIYVRNIAIANLDTPKIKISAEYLNIWRKTAGLQNNLNQAIKSINRFGANTEVVQEVYGLVSKLRAELIGLYP